MSEKSWLMAAWRSLASRFRRGRSQETLTPQLPNTDPAEYVAIAANGMLAGTANSNGRLVNLHWRNQKGVFYRWTRVLLPGQPNQIVFDPESTVEDARLFISMSDCNELHPEAKTVGG